LPPLLFLNIYFPLIFLRIFPAYSPRACHEHFYEHFCMCSHTQSPCIPRAGLVLFSRIAPNFSILFSASASTCFDCGLAYIFHRTVFISPEVRPSSGYCFPLSSLFYLCGKEQPPRREIVERDYGAIARSESARCRERGTESEEREYGVGTMKHRKYAISTIHHVIEYEGWG